MSDIDVVCRIYVGAVIKDAKVQVGAGGCAGGANITDNLTRGNLLSGGYDIVGHVHILARKSVLMVNGNIVACRPLIGCFANHTGAGCYNGSTTRSGKVHTIVEAVITVNRVNTVTKGARKASIVTGN